MNRDFFTLFFSRPLQTQHESDDGHDDWVNLDTSQVRQLQFPFGMAAKGVLKPQEHIAERASLEGFARRKLKLILRMYPDDCKSFDPGTAQKVVRNVKTLMQASGGDLVAVIVHNEPDWDPVHYDMRWGGNWGNNNPNAAAQYAELLRAWGGVLSSLGVKLVAGALSMRQWAGGSPALPGQVAWREWLAPVINRYYQGWGAHYYNHDWPVNNPTPWKDVELEANVTRFAGWLKWWQSLSHVELWIDEINVDRGQTPVPQLFRMQAIVGAAAFCEKHALGARVAMLSPFVSSGFVGSYPEGMILTDLKCYEHVGKFMQRKIYV